MHGDSAFQIRQGWKISKQSSTKCIICQTKHIKIEAASITVWGGAGRSAADMGCNHSEEVNHMPINLAKGQKVDLTKGNPGLKNIMVGLGWDVNAYDSGADFDLDAAAFMLGGNGKCPTEKEFVFYGNLEHGSGAVKHMGDNLTGEGEGDDEQIEIDLTKIPANISKIAFTVTIYDADVRGQNFGQVSNSFIRIVDETTGKELIRYDLGEDFSIETAVVVGELYRNNGEWKFNAIGSGFQGGLAALCGHYGIEVA